MSTSQTPTSPTSAIEFFHAEGMKCLERRGEVYFTAEEVGKQLGYADPRTSINTLYQRNILELQDYASDIKLMSEAGERSVRVFTEEGVYLLSFLAQTDKAAEFRRRVASLLKWVRQTKMQQARAEGARIAMALSAPRAVKIRTAVRYRGMGLDGTEIAKLMGLGQAAVGGLLADARRIGLLPPVSEARQRALDKARQSRRNTNRRPDGRYGEARS